MPSRPDRRPRADVDASLEQRRPQLDTALLAGGRDDRDEPRGATGPQRRRPLDDPTDVGAGQRRRGLATLHRLGQDRDSGGLHAPGEVVDLPEQRAEVRTTRLVEHRVDPGQRLTRTVDSRTALHECRVRLHVQTLWLRSDTPSRTSRCASAEEVCSLSWCWARARESWPLRPTPAGARHRPASHRMSGARAANGPTAVPLLGDDNDAFATNDSDIAVWNDVRDAAACGASNAYRLGGPGRSHSSTLGIDGHTCVLSSSQVERWGIR